MQNPLWEFHTVSPSKIGSSPSCNVIFALCRGIRYGDGIYVFAAGDLIAASLAGWGWVSLAERPHASKASVASLAAGLFPCCAPSSPFSAPRDVNLWQPQMNMASAWSVCQQGSTDDSRTFRFWKSHLNIGIHAYRTLNQYPSNNMIPKLIPGFYQKELIGRIGLCLLLAAILPHLHLMLPANIPSSLNQMGQSFFCCYFWTGFCCHEFRKINQFFSAFRPYLLISGDSCPAVCSHRMRSVPLLSSFHPWHHCIERAAQGFWNGFSHVA